FGLLKI
ncbi:unnamed protein product, partial [Allacma fusca]